MLASMRQSAQETPAAAARSRAVRSEFAFELSLQPPERMFHLGPRSQHRVRLKSSVKRMPPGLPASAVPASEAPASEVPASEVPASGAPASEIPASGVPASTPASAPPPALSTPVPMKSSKSTPERSVHMPAVPGAVMAADEASVALTLAAPFTNALSATGPAPVALSALVDQLPRSAV